VKKTAGPLRGIASIVAVPTDPPKQVGAWRSRDAKIFSAEFVNGAWSTPVAVGTTSPATSNDEPSLIPYRTIAVLAYADAKDNLNKERFYGVNGWLDTAAAARAINTEAGTKGPGVAAIVEELHAAYLTADKSVVVESKAATTWTATPVVIAGSNKSAAIAPAIVAIDPAATLKDLLLVYLGSDTKLWFSVRASGSKTWSAPKTIDAAVPPKDGFRLVAMSRGRAILTWRGANEKGYTSQYDGAKNLWSVPIEIATGGAPEVASIPAVTESRCGSADATVAYALKGGTVAVTRYLNGVPQGPFVVGGITNATYVGVGESP